MGLSGATDGALCVTIRTVRTWPARSWTMRSRAPTICLLSRSFPATGPTASRRQAQGDVGRWCDGVDRSVVECDFGRAFAIRRGGRRSAVYARPPEVLDHGETRSALGEAGCTFAWRWLPSQHCRGKADGEDQLRHRPRPQPGEFPAADAADRSWSAPPRSIRSTPRSSTGRCGAPMRSSTRARGGSPRRWPSAASSAATPCR